MDVTSDEIRTSRFQGTRHVYDRREVDAFLHRTAATLEMYERKLAVTQAHVESLEKALDLAHGRVRSIQGRDARIAELETALAAAQHNYESARSMLEAQDDGAAIVDTANDDLLREARRQAEALLEGATAEASLIRAEGDRLRAEAAAAAESAAAAARTEAEELRKRAGLQHAEMLDEIKQARLDALAALEAEVAAKRSSALMELEDETDRLAADAAAAAASRANLEARLAEAQHQAAKAEEEARQKLEAAEERVAAAEAEKTRLLAEIERTAAAAEAERQVFMEDAERMFEEAVARAEADREAASRQAGNGQADVAAAEVAQLRRQVAQLRTALTDVQRRFSDVSSLSAEELELAATLAAADLDDGDVVDLTSEAATAAPESDESPDDASVTVKSKWAEIQPIHAAPHADLEPASVAAEETEAAPTAARRPTWRDTLGTARKPEPDGEDDTGDPAVVGFYERRLAGLRERLKDAGPRDF